MWTRTPSGRRSSVSAEPPFGEGCARGMTTPPCDQFVMSHAGISTAMLASGNARQSDQVASRGRAAAAAPLCWLLDLPLLLPYNHSHERKSIRFLAATSVAPVTTPPANNCSIISPTGVTPPGLQGTCGTLTEGIIID